MLAIRFGWNYWEVQTLPSDYIDELWARIEAANQLRAKETETGDIVSRMKAANKATLEKMGLKK